MRRQTILYPEKSIVYYLLLMDPCTQVAYDHLSRYPKTTHQLKLFLKKKGFEEDEISAAVDTLTTMKVLDDRLYAELTLTSEVARKGKPLMVVIKKLLAKGVVYDLLKELQYDNEQNYQDGMCAALKVLWSKKASTDTAQRRMQRMVQRGYSYDLVREVSEEE